VSHDESKQEHLIDVLREFRNGILITRNADDELVSRPMNVARIDDDGTIYFSTKISSVKVDEIEDDPRVSVTFQGKTRFASVSGLCEVSQDRALIAELWQSDWDIWYPGGKEDPEVAILIIRSEAGAYWDIAGTKGVSFILRALKAKITGKEMEPGPQDGSGEKVPLH
jgi:general stress protein 26